MASMQHFTRPLLADNPITVQILGLCSALAVSRTLRPALIMAICVIGVLIFSNLAISLLRRVMPRSIRLILEMTIIASAVIVADEILKAYAPDVSQILSVFVGLIITNCIVLGRAEAFAMHHGPADSLADALGNGAAYGAILLFVASVRELAGSGALFGYPLLTSQAWFVPNQIMLYAPSAFFIIGLIVWAVRAWRTEQAETQEDRPRHLKYEVQP
jgi:Na+-transporting NADH:ubiquinone oxidoreductase subunit D